MTAKRNRLEIMRDILHIVHENRDSMKPTPLLRKSNMSSKQFKRYYGELLEKGFLSEQIDMHGNKFVRSTDKGIRFLEKYSMIVNFIEEFEL